MIGVLLPVLRQRRTARRDAALARLARARSRVEGLQAEVRRCESRLREALASLYAVRAGQGQAADPQWRLALLPSCEALVDRERLACTQALAAMQPALQEQARAQGAVLAQERALLRTDELDALQRAEDRQSEASADEATAEDLATAWRPASPRRPLARGRTGGLGA